MLCRALLTIIAISCTFSREIIVNAHDQGTQRLVQIKDLICVLLLSGLQKEDLDVNMLKKLQRHNVNIDDMNNENLRQECISRSTFSQIDRRIEITTEEIRVQKQQNKSNNGSTKAQLQTLIQYLIDSKSDDHNDVSLIEESTKKITDIENYTTLQADDNPFKPNLNEAVNYETPNTKNNYTKKESMNGMEKPDLQKFIKLWNMYNKEYTKESSSRETAFPILLQVENHTSRPNALKLNDKEKGFEMEYNISKVIMDYISKNKINPTTTSPPSTKNYINDAISYQIERYLAVNNDNTKLKNTNENNKNKNAFSEMLNLMLNNIQRDNNVKIVQKNNNDEILKNKAKKYLSDILWTDEQLNEPVIQYNQIITQRPKLAQNGFKLRVMQSSELHKNNIIINKINDKDKQIMNENINIKDVKIPFDIVKEIAESVKAIVLKDLRNELSTTTPKITITNITTEKEPTTFKQEKLQDSNKIMEKFMDLFQQFKTIKEKTVITGETKLKTNDKKTIQHEYNEPLKLEYPPRIPPINPYGVIMPMAQMTPIFTNPYDQNSNLNAQFVPDSNKNNNLKSVHKITQVNIFHNKNEQQPIPLTIQTNSYEIPPLGIPVSKPINMYNQNIVVTTKNPFMRPKIDRQHGNVLHHELNYNIKRNSHDGPTSYDMSNRQSLNDNFNLDKFKDSNSRDTRFTSKNNKRQRYTSDYNDNNPYGSRLYKPHFNKSDYDRMRHRNQEIKKFHERLERTGDSNVMDDREDCCRVKVASRQQLPLNSIRNRSRYDDTHFRNFLKTQQKVNDMLERILATKTKSDGPRSVEVP